VRGSLISDKQKGVRGSEVNHAESAVQPKGLRGPVRLDRRSHNGNKEKLPDRLRV
jgi:hypothetical protein